MGEELAAKAGGPVTTLWIERAGHNDFFDVGGKKIDQAVAQFAAGASPGHPMNWSSSYPSRSSSALVISANTSFHSPSLDCRNSRMVGYQGVSFRPCG